MIINLYIVSHILHDRHLYECILWSFFHALKKPRFVPQPLVENIAIVQPASVQMWEMWQLSMDTIMYPPV